MKARDIMTENPACVTPESTVQEAARLMESQDVGSLPVVESSSSKRLVGVITDRDLAIRVLARGESASAQIRNVMSSDVQCAGPDDSLDDLESTMGKHQVRRLPVVDDQNRVLGMIAQADLARERKAVGEQDFAKVIEKISQPAGIR